MLKSLNFIIEDKYFQLSSSKWQSLCSFLKKFLSNTYIWKKKTAPQFCVFLFVFVCVSGLLCGFFCFCFCGNGVLLCYPGWTWIQTPASTSGAAGITGLYQHTQLSVVLSCKNSSHEKQLTQLATQHSTCTFLRNTVAEVLCISFPFC